jgi:predicted dehydrogenase
VGAGGIAARHIQALKEIGEVEIAAVTGPSPEKARGLAEKCDPTTKVYANYPDLLANEALDALYICVPPFAHGEIELAAVARGLPFFVEKPLSADAETAEKIFSAVQAKGLVTAVGYQWRYLNTVELTQTLVAAKPARLALGYWLDVLPPPAWWAVESLSGGQMVEQTTHIFDLARLLVGEIATVYAVGRRFSSAGVELDIDRVSIATVEFASGAIGTFSSTSILNGSYRKGLELFSEGRTINLSYQDVTIEEGPGQPRKEKVAVDPFVLENRDFLNAVRGQGNRIKCDYLEALRTHRVTQATTRSIREGRPVKVAAI